MNTNNNRGWIFRITILSFFISIIFSLIAELLMPKSYIIINIVCVLVFIGLGVLSDIISIAIHIVDVSIFHAMSSKKLSGARTGIFLVQNRLKVSSFCDVISDICSVLSGTSGLAVAIKMASTYNLSSLLITVLITGIIAAITICVKALTKNFAIKKSNKIIYNIAKIFNIFYKTM